MLLKLAKLAQWKIAILVKLTRLSVTYGMASKQILNHVSILFTGEKASA
jgi:hypothetical protein